MPSASGQPASIKRVVYITQPFGTIGELFFPPEPGQPMPTWTPPYWEPRARKRHSFSGEAPAVFDAPRFDTLALSPLVPHAGRTIVLENLNNLGGGHDRFASLLTGDSENRPRTPSIDILLGRERGSDTLHPSMQLSLQGQGHNTYSYTSWQGNGSTAPAERDTLRIFNDVFGGVGGDSEAMNRVREDERSILDGALRQASDLRDRLGSEDRRRLELYLDSLRQAEMRLDASFSMS
ncbi:MAG: DUF1552 domain-containing protein, partial [Myxococcota bacterium]